MNIAMSANDASVVRYHSTREAEQRVCKGEILRACMRTGPIDAKVAETLGVTFSSAIVRAICLSAYTG